MESRQGAGGSGVTRTVRSRAGRHCRGSRATRVTRVQVASAPSGLRDAPALAGSPGGQAVLAPLVPQEAPAPSGSPEARDLGGDIVFTLVDDLVEEVALKQPSLPSWPEAVPVGSPAAPAEAPPSPLRPRFPLWSNSFQRYALELGEAPLVAPWAPLVARVMLLPGQASAKLGKACQ